MCIMTTKWEQVHEDSQALNFSLSNSLNYASDLCVGQRHTSLKILVDLYSKLQTCHDKDQRKYVTYN